MFVILIAAKNPSAAESGEDVEAFLAWVRFGEKVEKNIADIECRDSSLRSE